MMTERPPARLAHTRRHVSPRRLGAGASLVAAPLLALATLAGSPASAQDSAHRLGLLLPFTGQYAWVGANVQPVAEMIAEEVNDSGGIGGRDIAFTQGDTEGVVDAGATAAQKLINVDNVLGLIGPTSLSFSGAKQLIIDNRVPMVSPTAGTTALDNECPTYCFRTVPSDSLGGLAIGRAATSSRFLAGDEAFDTPALMVGQAPALISFKEPIENAFEDFGAPLATSVEYTTGQASYRSLVQRVMREDPDLIVLIGSPEDSARIMSNAFQAGYQGAWFVTQDQTTSEFIELAGADLVEGIYGLEEVASPEAADRNEAFRERFRDYAGEDPQIFATNTYDAMNVFALAMLRAELRDGEVTRASVHDNIRAISQPGDNKTVVHDFTEGRAVLEDGGEVNYNGLVGPIDFDENGNITAPFGIRQVQDGSWSTVTIMGADALMN